MQQFRRYARSRPAPSSASLAVRRVAHLDAEYSYVPQVDDKPSYMHDDAESIYNNVGRSGSLTIDVLSKYDQIRPDSRLESVNRGIAAMSAGATSRVLEIGSGYGGPARHIANTTGAHVTAVELQEDMNAVAAELTARCGLAGRVAHVPGDAQAVLQRVGAGSYDAVLMWLSWCHFRYPTDKARLLEKVVRALKPGSVLYIEDLFEIAPFAAGEKDLMAKHHTHLLTRADHVNVVEAAGFEAVSFTDMTSEHRELARLREVRFRADHETNVLLHGEATVAKREQFFAEMVTLYDGGNFGSFTMHATIPHALAESADRDGL